MKLALQTAASSLIGLGFFALALFLPAGTFAYWQAWVFIAVFSALLSSTDGATDGVVLSQINAPP